jgi:hypothetical protein
MVLCLAYRIYLAIVGFYDRESYFDLDKLADTMFVVTDMVA